MKLRVCFLMVVIMMLSFCGCANTQTQNAASEQPESVRVPGEAEASEEAEATDEVEDIDEKEATEETDWYEKMLADSLVSTGNNGRLDKVLAKLEASEPVTIAAIGGSITEGTGATIYIESYGDKFVAGLKERYPQAQINYVNAGMSGTPSTLGMMRYERDVTKVSENDPDLVIVEFAVNDFQEPTSGRAYESLVRTILEKENAPAVVLVFSVFQSQWNMQSTYIPIGRHYGLPMVSILNGVAAAYETGDLTDVQFFADSYHPKNYGHNIMSDCILYMVDKKLEEGLHTDISELPENSVKPLHFMGMHFVTAAEEISTCTDCEPAVVSAGGFSETDDMVQNFMRGGGSTFPDNWQHTAESGNDAFEVKLTCKNILLNFKTSSSAEYGSATVYVDDKLVKELSGHQADGWNNSNVVLVLDEAEGKEHVLKVVMSKGQEDKKFTILGIGYTN